MNYALLGIAIPISIAIIWIFLPIPRLIDTKSEYKKHLFKVGNRLFITTMLLNLLLTVFILAISAIFAYFDFTLHYTNREQKEITTLTIKFLDLGIKIAGVFGLLTITGAILVSFNRTDDENSNKA